MTRTPADSTTMTQTEHRRSPLPSGVGRDDAAAVPPRRRRRARTTTRGAALALFLAAAAASSSSPPSADAFGSPSSPRRASSATVRSVASTRTRTSRRREQRRGSGSPSSGSPKTALGTTTVVERVPVDEAGGVPPEYRRRTPAIGIKRRSSICGSESRAHRQGLGQIQISDISAAYGAISTRRGYVRGHVDIEDPSLYAITPTPSAAATSLTAAQRKPTPASSMPPWLAQPGSPPPSGAKLQSQLSKLRWAMSTHSNLSDSEVHAVVQGIEAAARGNAARLSGAMDFLSILVETMEMGRDALIAAAFHYCACVTAREDMGDVDEMQRHVVTGMAVPDCLGANVGEFDALYMCPLAGSGIENFGPSVVRIALDAARLKGTEAVAAAVSAASGHVRATRADADNLRSLLLSANAGGEWRALALRCAACLYRIRGLQRHRARTKNLARFPTADEIRVGREALHIYAPLAHRLGMHKLKSELEGAAFRALYWRQHEAVTSLLYNRLDSGEVNARGIPVRPKSPLYFADINKSSSYLFSLDQSDEEGSAGFGMKNVLTDITARVKRMLYEDDDLMANVNTIEIAARVKEPYSLWRKMLKLHLKDGEEKNRKLSVLGVHDAVALRVIVSACKEHPNETEGDTAEKERRLCYYVHSLCSDNLGPPSRPTKDYIRKPKPNGYSSLHYSSRMRWHGEDWPFEVQVRTTDMHRVAEYGLAAHWEYKARSQQGNQKHGNSHVYDVVHADRYLKSVEEWNTRRTTGGGEPPAPFLEDSDLEQTSAAFEVALEDDLLFATVGEVDRHDFGHALRAERVKARAERLAPYLKAFTAARTDLAREKVFVFLNRAGTYAGERIRSLPAGARVLDALREEERRTGEELRLADEDRGVDAGERLSVLLNGSLTSMTKRLENGDVLTFFSSRHSVEQP